MSPNRAPQDTNGWERWRGATDQRLQNIEKSQDAMARDVADVKHCSTENNTLLQQLVKAGGEAEEKAENRTIRWLAEKVGIPVLLGINTIILGLILAHLF